MSIIGKNGKPLATGDVSITDLTTLSNHVKAGKIALPEFQRPQVWNDQERKELVISLCLGVPIGSFLLWEFDHQVQKDTEIIEFPGISTQKSNVDYLLVDGQQRMTTLSQLTTSDFGKSFKVEFRKVSSNRTRPILHKIPGIKGVKPYTPDLTTINKKREMLVAELAGSAKIINLEADALKVANTFRNSLNGTSIPVHTFDKNEDRQWVIYVYQTCNLAGKPLNDTDHAEAALGYVYPEIKELSDNFISTLSLWDSEDKDTPRKLLLRGILDELYNTPFFTTCKQKGLDVLNPRIISKKGNQKTNTPEISVPLSKSSVKSAFTNTKRAFTKLHDMFLGSWQIPVGGGKILLENETVVMLAWFREHEKSKTKPTKEEIGLMSKHMMQSMALRPTSGRSTQPMTVNACNYVRDDMAKCWSNIEAEWKLRELKPGDMGNPDAEVAQISKNSLIFHLYKLTLFRNQKAMDLLDSNSKLTSTTPNIEIDHFYPKSRLGHLSEEHSLMKRKDHLANYVVMKQWSNNNKTNDIPDALLTQKKLWPKGDQDKIANFNAHCIPTKPTSTKWVINGKQLFDDLAALRKDISKLKRKCKSKNAKPADIKIWESTIESHEKQKLGISQSIEVQFRQFLQGRSKAMVKLINDMTKEIAKNGF